MSKYFRKFTCDADLSHANMTLLKGSNSFNFVSGESTITYDKISNPISLARHVFHRKVFAIEPHLVYYAQVHGPGHLLPHRDHGVHTVANFYFKSNQCVTTFYQQKKGTAAIKYDGHLSVQTNNIYELDTLDPVESFTAHDGDCYLLSVSEIHGVYSPYSGVREFINMQWYNVSIDEIYSSLINY